jgi:hypothetical protein
MAASAVLRFRLSFHRAGDIDCDVCRDIGGDVLFPAVQRGLQMVVAVVFEFRVEWGVPLSVQVMSCECSCACVYESFPLLIC